MGEFVNIKCADGTMRSYIALPRHPNGAAIVLASSLWGLNADLIQVADYYSDLGYATIAPNLFWRLREHHGIDYDFEALDEVMGLMDASNDDDGQSDLTQALSEIRRISGCTKAGIVGWCYGGRIGCLFVTQKMFDTVVGIYPTYIETKLDISKNVDCPMSLHLSGIEQYGTVEDATERTEEAFASVEQVEVFTYPGVKHGFDFAPPHPHFDHPAARLCDSRVALFLRRTLSGSQ